MKQFVFMAITAFLGTGGAFLFSPVYGIAIYYLYAVLRPQFIWEWVSFGGFEIGDFDWSRYVAVATLLATALWRLGVFAPPKAASPPWYGNPRYTASHYLFLAFTAWICLTYVTAESTDRAWPFFLEYVKIFVMFICATLVLRTLRELWLIYFVVVGAAVYIAYEINVYYLSAGYMFLYRKGYGGLDNNGAALMLAMTVPMCFFAWEAVRHKLRWGFLLAIPVIIHAVLMSYSRGAMLSLCVVAPLMLLRARNKGLLLLVYGALAVAMPVMAGKEIQERFFSISKHEADESAASRKQTWAIAVRMANERPVFGFGIRNSNLYTQAYGADMAGRTIHSQYLQTAADSGWVALGLYLALIGSVFLGCAQVRHAVRRYTDPESLRVRALAAGLETSLAVFCFGAIFLSLEHFELPYIVMLLAMQLLSITRAVMAKAGPPPVPPAVPS